MNRLTLIKKIALPIALLASWSGFAFAQTNAPPPVTARDFYNAGTRRLAATNNADAEKMFQSALAAQDESIQPPALYNLGHVRFAAGGELLKKGPDAQKIAVRSTAALAAGETAIRQSESAPESRHKATRFIWRASCDGCRQRPWGSGGASGRRAGREWPSGRAGRDERAKG